jgi:hypothetical protein
VSSRLEDILVERLSKDEAEVLRAVMQTETGRRFVYEVVIGSICKWGWRCLDPAIREGGASTRHSDFLDGMQEIARRLKYESQMHCLESWHAAEAESNGRARHAAALQRQEKPNERNDG